MKPDRWLATVLFTDIVGSTERAAELGDYRWRELLQAHHALARRELQRHGGRELNTTGDGFLATFEIPERAIRCACAIRDAVRRLGMEIRAGLHTGEVELIEKTVGGLAVHIGARVAGEAAPGEVLVSGTVRDMVAGSGFGFEDRGAHELKGVPGEWRLFVVTSAPVRLPVASFWSRAREARLPRVLLVYVAACAGVLWLAAYLRGELELPPWVLPLAVVLLLIGLVMLAATAWVQSHPLTAARAEREEVPGSWEIDLRDVGKSVARGRLPHLTWARAILGGIFAFSLLFGLAGLYVLLEDRSPDLGPGDALAGPGPALAVLPFRIVGPDMELWREGMVDLLSTNLDGAAGIRTVTPRTLLSRWRGQIAEGEEPSDQQALQVARQVGAKYALVGSMVALGGEVRLSAQVYDLRSGTLQGETQVKGAPDSVPALVDRLSLEILRAALVPEPGTLPHLDLRRLTTASLPALKAYLEGEQAFRRSHWEEAIASLTRAVEADSTFALALHRLSLAHGWIVGFGPQAVEYSRRAARLIDRLPEREALLLQGNALFGQGRVGAIKTLEELTTRYPDDAEGWYLLGDAYLHVGVQALHPREKSRQALRRALELDPAFGPAYIHLVWDAFDRPDSAAARELIQSYRQIDPTSTEAKAFDLAYRLVWGDVNARDEARADLDTAGADELEDASQFLRWSRELSEDALRVSRALLSERHPSTAREMGRASFVRTYLGRGRIREARDALAVAAASGPLSLMLGPGMPAERLLLILSLTGYGHGPDARRATEVLAVAPASQDRFLLGALAAREERWKDVRREIEALDASAAEGESPQDSLNRFDGPALAQALRGYEAALRGDSAAAIRDLQAALPKIPGICPGDGCYFHAMLRYELGRLLLGVGRPREALRYLESVEFYVEFLTPAELYIGRAYEELGELAEARLRYERFVRWWQDADPELRPLWEEGRRAATRLTGVQKL